MAPQTTLDQFLSRSATPRILLTRYTHLDALDLLLPSLRGTVPHEPEEVVRNWAAAFLALVDAPEDFTGVCLVEPAVRYLVTHFLQKPTPLSDPTPLVLLDALFVGLSQSPNQPTFLRCPPQVRAQLFTFHIDASRANGAGNIPCLLYQLWGPRLHLGLRTIQCTVGSDDTVKSYTCPSRAFFTFFPHAQLQCLPRGSTRALFDCHIEWFLKAHPNLPGKVATRYKGNLERLYRGCGSRPHPHAGPEISPSPNKTEEDDLIEREELDDVPPALTTTTTRQTTPHEQIDLDIVIESAFHLEDADTGGIDPEPHGTEFVYAFPRHQRVVPHPPSLQYDQVNRYILHQFPFWWDRCSVALYQLIQLYRFVELLLTESGTAGIALFLLLLLFTGRSPRELAQTCIATYPMTPGTDDNLPRDRLLIDINRRWLFFYQSKGRANFQPESGSGWLPSSRWVGFPIPRPLLPIFDQYVIWLGSAGKLQAGNRFFWGSHRSSAVRTITPELLSVIITRTPQAHLLPSPAHLASAFLPLMVHGFSLDETIARLLSGRGLKRVYAPLHYTRAGLADLFNEYEERCAALHASVISGLPEPGWWSASSSVTATLPPADLAVGSPILRTKNATRDLVTTLMRVVTDTGKPRKAEDIILHHNAYCVLCYLMVLSLGIRPRNKLPWTQEDVTSRVAHLLIADKQSADWFEQRLLLLPPLINHSLVSLGTGRCRLKQALRYELGSVQANALPNDLFFFLAEDGTPVPFKLQIFRNYLRRLVPSFPADAADNEGRHRLRTALFSDGLAADFIDAWLGHTRGGRESLARHSSALYGQAMTKLSDRLEQHLHDLGFREVTYFPTYQGGTDD